MNPRALGLGAISALIVFGVILGLHPADEAPSTPAVDAPHDEAHQTIQAPTRTPPAARVLMPPSAALLDGEPVEPPRSLPGLVRGRLAWLITGLPIEGAVVQAVRAWPDTVLVNDVECDGQERVPLRRRDLFVGEPATTDRFGQFAVAVPEIDGPLALLALRGGQCIEARPLQPGPAATRTLELGDWLLQQRGEVCGTVLDATGRPVRGARVRLVDVPLEGGTAFHPLARAARLYGARDFEPASLIEEDHTVVAIGLGLSARDELLPFPEVETDLTGRFSLCDARPGASTLVVQPSMAPNLTEQVVVQSGGLTDIGIIRLAEAGCVQGRLVDDRNRSVAGAEVCLDAQDGELLTPPVITSQDGSFVSRKAGDPPNKAYARRSASEPWQACEIRRREGRTDLRLGTGRKLTVTVLPPGSGTPVASRVEMRYRRAFGQGFDGVIPIPETSPGEHECWVPWTDGLLVVRADGFAPLVDLVAWNVRDLRLQLPTCSARFAVRTGDGRPVANAAVFARVESEPQLWRRWGDLRPGHVKLGETNDDGVFEAPGLWPSLLAVVAFHPLHGRAERSVKVEPDGPPHAFVLGARTGGRLIGVLTENSLPPQDRWLVRAHRRGSDERRVTLSENDGSFAFGSLMPGDWALGLAMRIGPPGAAEIVTPLTDAAARRGWPLGTRLVPVLAGEEQHTSLEIRGWVEDTHRPGRTGTVRTDGVAARGLAVHLHALDSAGIDRLRRQLPEVQAKLRAQTNSGRPDEDAVRSFQNQRLVCSVDPPYAIAVTDDRGQFVIHPAGGKRLEIVASVDGLQQILWSGAHRDGEPIDIRTGSALVEVQGGDGHRLAHRMFGADGQGDIAGVRLRAVTDRFGVLHLAGVPRGVYALRSLTQGGVKLSFPAPAFTVTGPNWTSVTVVAQ